MTRGFEAVAEEFDPGPGAAFAATVDGELVVDLWGGPGWQEDTLALCETVEKGVPSVGWMLTETVAEPPRRGARTQSDAGITIE